MTLQEVRAKIDAIDPELRKLIMGRFDCSYAVAETKFADNSTTVFRADREQDIIARLSAEVPEDRRLEYIATIRKIMEASRMYQYGLLYDWNGEEKVFAPLVEKIEVPKEGSLVTVRITRNNQPNAMSQILSMIGDYGYDMKRMEMVGDDLGDKVTFDLTIRGNLAETHMKKLIFQLSRESEAFEVLSAE